MIDLLLRDFNFFCKFARQKRYFARMVELVDTLDLKSNGRTGCAGSSPAPGTLKSRRIIVGFFYAGSEALTNSKYDMYSNFQGEDCKSFFT